MHTDRIKVATEIPAALAKMFQHLLFVREQFDREGFYDLFSVVLS
jgi:hypothetical protein